MASDKIKRDKTKIKLVIYFLCLIGFAYQTYHMFDAILNGSLIYSEHYVSLATGRMPTVVFCFAYNTSLIDRNHKLTGDYLKN